MIFFKKELKLLCKPAGERVKVYALINNFVITSKYLSWFKSIAILMFVNNFRKYWT